jgi:hypothetical protein
MIQRLARPLASRSAAAVIVALAVALAAPSLNTGFVADDHIQEDILRGGAGIPGLPVPRDLFSFASGDPRKTHQLMDAGVFPWTTDPEVRLAFWRPISSATHAIDHALAPGSAPFAHAHNLVWFALALAAAALFYRRFLGAGWIAMLALLLYAVDDTHGPAVGWIANRNALCALAIALPSLVFHDRWRRDGWLPGALLGPLTLCLGLLAGESALAICAYLAAYALHVDKGPRRLFVLTPYALSVVLWRVVYQAMGYGASGSGVYLDPGRDPVGFLRQLPSRISLLLLGQLALPWSDFAELYRYISPKLLLAMTLFALVVLALIAITILPIWKRDPLARFFATGMVLSAVPVCATFPADRLLTFVGIGAMGLVAQRLATAPQSRIGKLAVAGLVAIHLVLAPPLSLLRSRSMVTVDAPLANADESLPRTPEIADQTIVLVNPPADLFAGYLALTRASKGEPRPRAFRWLASGTSAVEIVREDERTLRVRPARGYLENVTEHMLRSPRHPLPVGARVELSGMTAEVLSALPDGRPAEVRFRFDTDLNNPKLYWAQFIVDRYSPFAVPKIGERVTLPASDFIRATLPTPPDRAAARR